MTKKRLPKMESVLQKSKKPTTNFKKDFWEYFID